MSHIEIIFCITRMSVEGMASKMLKNWLFQRKAAEDEKTKNIKIVYDDGVDQFVKNVIYNFCRNLERNYLFVDPLNIYVKNKLYIMVNDSDKVAGLFMRSRACFKIATPWLF